MPMSPAVFLGLGAMALLVLSGKKKRKKKEELPPPPEPEPKTDDDVPPPEPETQHILVLLEDYRLPEGSVLPEGLSDEQWRDALWIDVPGCNAWALGKKFKESVIAPYLPVFYDAYVDITMQEDPELATLPPDQWVDYQFVQQGKTQGLIEDPYKVAVAKALMDVYDGRYADCVTAIPEASDFASGEAYAQAWVEFANNNKNLYALYYNLANYAKDHMIALYEQRFPDEAKEWFEREWAYEAAYQENLNLEDMTDWAYHHAYPECPEVLDPNNPAHEECKETWLRLRGYIQEYL